MEEKKEEIIELKTSLKPKISKEMRDELSKLFPEEAIDKHPTKTFLSTLKAIYIVERLNKVFGFGRWTVEHVIEKETPDYILMRGQLIILDYNVTIPEQFGGHATTGKNTELADGYKSAVTDILSKSASYLEIGIDVFKGKVKPPGGDNKNTNNEKPKEGDFKKLKKDVFEEEWNGKIYGSSIFIKNIKYNVDKTSLERLKKHKKFKPDGK